MNWNETLIRASSMGYLLTEPQLKADKEAGNLSKTAKTHLISVYINEKYGRYKDVKTKEIVKGIEVEDDSIEMLSLYLKIPFKKNQERVTNEFITGHPDLFVGDDINNSELIIDIKSSYDLFTFLNNLPDKLDSLYHAQLQCYMWLTNAQKSAVTYVLANTPSQMIEEQKMWLLKKMNVISEESLEYVRECMKLEHSLTFDDVPLEEKVLIYPVERDDEFIENMKTKVTKAREFLQEIEDTHLKFNIGKL